MKHFTLVLAVLTSTAAAQITCIDDPGLMAPDSVCINFENEVTGALANPYVAPGVTFSSPIGMGITDVSQWAADGTAVSNFTLHNTSSHLMSMPFVDITIVFDEPVDMFILGWFDANYPGNEVRVYDAAGLLLGTCEPQVGPPGGCCAAFVGAQSTSFDIKSVVVHPATHDDWYSIDNLYFHNDTIGSGYCFPTNNSTGTPAFIVAAGSDVVAQDNFRLQATSLPSGEFGYFLAGQGQGVVQPPGADGFLCLVGSQLGRLNAISQIFQGPSVDMQIDISMIPLSPTVAIAPGETWNFQAWYRDSGSSNFTNAVSVNFQ